MKWQWSSVVMLLVSMGLFLLNGCGGGGDSISYPLPVSSSIRGVAAGGAAMANVPVSLKDSATPAKELLTTSGVDGSYLFNVDGLTMPFILKAVSGGKNYYSFSTGGLTNISPYTTMLLAVASGGANLDALYNAPDKTTLWNIAYNHNLDTALQSIQTKLQPLLSLFDNGNNNPITDQFTANHTGLNAMLDTVSVDLAGWATITLRNSATNQIIYTGPTNNFNSGTLTPGNIPKPQVTVAITPPNASVSVNGSVSFAATVTGSPVRTVTWSVVESGGGTITTAGVYTAPTTAGTYTVKAVSDANPAKSATASVVVAVNPPQATPPVTPTGATASAGDGKVIVSWTASAGATSYNLYYSTSSGVTKTNGTKLSGVTSPYTVISLTNNTKYYFVVTAVNGKGESAVSEEVSATQTAQAACANIAGSWSENVSFTITAIANGQSQTQSGTASRSVSITQSQCSSTWIYSEAGATYTRYGSLNGNNITMTGQASSASYISSAMGSAFGLINFTTNSFNGTGSISGNSMAANGSGNMYSNFTYQGVPISLTVKINESSSLSKMSGIAKTVTLNENIDTTISTTIANIINSSMQ